MNYIISYPRSGNHWVRFILEFLSYRPTLGCIESKNDKPIYTDMFKIGENPIVIRNDDPIARKEHSINDIKVVKGSKLVLILRDYKECILRHTYNSPKIQTSDAYFGLINLYDKYDGEKMICYYEDLIKTPDDVAKEFFIFFNLDDKDRLNDFIKNHKKYAKLNKTPIKRQWQGSISGNDLNFHKNRYKNDFKEIENHINNKYSYLKNKYIK